MQLRLTRRYGFGDAITRLKCQLSHKTLLSQLKVIHFLCFQLKPKSAESDAIFQPLFTQNWHSKRSLWFKAFFPTCRSHTPSDLPTLDFGVPASPILNTQPAQLTCGDTSLTPVGTYPVEPQWLLTPTLKHGTGVSLSKQLIKLLLFLIDAREIMFQMVISELSFPVRTSARTSHLHPFTNVAPQERHRQPE